MIQLRKIRVSVNLESGGKSKKFDAPLSPPIEIENHESLFQDFEKIVAQIPEHERFNIHYTLGHRPVDAENDGRPRVWGYQTVIGFDIDHIDKSIDVYKYVDVVAGALQVDARRVVFVDSGHGLHVVLRLKSAIMSEKVFKEQSRHYKAVCEKIESGLLGSGLRGECDMAAFEPNRMFRMPGTINRKDGKGDVECRLICGQLSAIDWDLKRASGLPEVDESEQIDPRLFTKRRVDGDEVQSGCRFLAWSKENQNQVSEPQWYAMLTIVGRLPGGERLAHEYSCEAVSYVPRETSLKLKHALESSGPRTCENINKLWGRCGECPHWGRVKSPIQIKSEDFIATRDSGFHSVSITKNGESKYTPEYEDLARFYDEVHPYINVAGEHFIFNGRFWEAKDVGYTLEFAQTHFDPACTNHKAEEFVGLVRKRSNHKSPQFFQESVSRKINFRNCVLDIDTMQTRNVTPEDGFKWQLDFDFDPIAECPLFDQFLKDVTCGDEKLEQMLQEFGGYIISNDRPSTATKFLFMVGDGSNGKSTLIEVFRALCGPAMSFVSPHNLAHRDDYVATLNGALANLIPEVPNFVDKVFWEKMKGFSDGSPVQVRKLHGTPFTLDVRTKFVFACNQMPVGGTPSGGFFRRFLIAPFDATFSPDQPGFVRNMGQRITESEMPGVFNRMLEAYHRLKANDYNFTMSPRSNEALDEYREQADSVTEWVNAHADRGQVAWAPGTHGEVRGGFMVYHREHGWLAVCSGMYSSYADWAREQGEKPCSAKSFGMRLKSVFKTKGWKVAHKPQVYVAAKKVVAFQGIRAVSEMGETAVEKREEF
jgi:P4 family phage/plasmid primase-like protien